MSDHYDDLSEFEIQGRVSEGLLPDNDPQPATSVVPTSTGAATTQASTEGRQTTTSLQRTRREFGHGLSADASRQIAAAQAQRVREQAQLLHDVEYSMASMSMLLNLLDDIHVQAQERAEDMSMWWQENNKPTGSEGWRPHKQTIVGEKLIANLRDSLLSRLTEKELEASEHGLHINHLTREFDAHVKAEADQERAFVAAHNAQVQAQEASSATSSTADAQRRALTPSALEVTTTSNAPPTPSQAMVHIQPIQRRVTWEAFSFESTVKFRDFCATQLRYESTAATFEPWKHIADKVVRELKGHLTAIENLRMFKDSFPHTKESFLKVIDLIIRHYWNDKERTERNKDVLVRREVLQDVLRNYEPEKPLTAFVSSCAEFFRDITETELSTLGEKTHVTSFFRDLREKNNGSMALNRLVRLVEVDIRLYSGPPRTFQDICDVVLEKSSDLLEGYLPLASLGFAYTRRPNKAD